MVLILGWKATKSYQVEQQGCNDRGRQGASGGVSPYESSRSWRCCKDIIAHWEILGDFEMNFP